MRMSATIAFALAASALAVPALAEENPFADATALASEEMEQNRGGTEVLVPGAVQTNDNSQTASNSDNTITIGSGGHLSTGDIYSANLSGNSGITAVMQNTGNLVNMNHITSINVYTQ